jgi:hypothetical protein
MLKTEKRWELFFWIFLSSFQSQNKYLERNLSSTILSYLSSSVKESND